MKVLIINDYPAIVGGAERYLINERTAQKLANKVLEIIHDDVILTRISTVARENISLEGYNASRQEIADIYKSVLSC